jgi:UDP-glucose 4-epimerase
VDKGFRKGDPLEVFANPTLAKKDLNWFSRVELTTSVKTQLKHFKNVD